MTIPIVDLNDQIIGHKPRADLDYAQDIFRTASLWIVNSHGDILLAQRKFDKKVDPGKWAEAVGGTVEGQDSYETTVLREAAEELGLTSIKLKAGPKQFITTPCSYFVQWYTAVVDWPIERFIPQADEVEQIAWVPKRVLLEELKTTPKKYIDAMPDVVRLVDGQ